MAAYSLGIMSTTSNPSRKQKPNAFFLLRVYFKTSILFTLTLEHSLVKQNEIIIAILDQLEFVHGAWIFPEIE